MNSEDERRWKKAILLYTKNRVKDSLFTFKKLKTFSKVLFNIGIIYQDQDDHDNALRYFNACVKKDGYLVVALQQRAFSYFAIGDFNSAKQDFTLVLTLLTRNASIDYAGLGLDYIVHRAEIFYNRAICNHELGHKTDFLNDMSQALRFSTTKDQREVIEPALHHLEISPLLFATPQKALFELPDAFNKKVPGKTLKMRSSVYNGPKKSKLDMDLQRSCSTPVDHKRNEPQRRPSTPGILPDRNMNSTPSPIKLKILYKKTIYAIVLPYLSYKLLYKKAEGWNGRSCKLRFSYKDENGDYINICNDDDLNFAADEELIEMFEI